MSVTRYWVVNDNLLTSPHPFLPGIQEVVMAADFDACAEAACDMAGLVMLPEMTEDWAGEHSQQYQRAQAILEQYGGMP